MAMEITPQLLAALVKEFQRECFAIGDWWLEYSMDLDNGGFYGAVSEDNVADKSAAKCVILNTRILWFFSEAATRTQCADYRLAATRAFDFIRARFFDSEYGGVVWMLDAMGQVVDGRKHTYAQAFAIYGLSAYYSLTEDPLALDLAMQCFALLERHAKDTHHNGYLEAFNQSWGALDDIRLSAKEDNSPKTMNTNLHVLEAYTALLNVVASHPRHGRAVAEALYNELTVFCDHVVNLETGHLSMFMDEAWRDHSRTYSFGHDIESSWLIHKAIKSLQPTGYDTSRYLPHVFRLAKTALVEGLQADGGMGDEYELHAQCFGPSAWWVQAEAMIGFTNMWYLGQGEQYLVAAIEVWRHVQAQYLDKDNGEWLWFAKRDCHHTRAGYKIGAWKAPYHNGRAMMQMVELLNSPH